MSADDSTILSGEALKSFWSRRYAAPCRVVVLSLRGFDPRLCDGLELLCAVAQDHTSIDVYGIDLLEAENSLSRQSIPEVKDNWERVHRLVEPRGKVSISQIPMLGERWGNVERPRIGDKRVYRKVVSEWESFFYGYDEIVVDVSSMPRGILVPVMMALLEGSRDSGGGAAHLNVFVSEDADWDGRIVEDDVDRDPIYLAPLGVPKGRSAVYWIPVLSEGRTRQCRNIVERVKPHEVAAVLPSPARNPRRADEMLGEYHTVLFGEGKPKPLLVSENNPLELVRQVRRYVESESNVCEGACEFVLSALCSKLMTVGVALTAFDLSNRGFPVSIAHNECGGYIHPGDGKPEAILYGAWLAGIHYDE